MTKNMSWTGTHPAVDLWAEARQERDEWQARAEAAEAALAAAQARVRELELQLAGWDSLKLMAIERQEDVPWQAFLIEFREPTEAERAYGKTLISLLPAPPIDTPPRPNPSIGK